MEQPATLHQHEFEQTIVSLYGDRGAAWLQGLSSLIAGCEARWSIAVGMPLPHLTYNYVAPATGPDGTAQILKLGVPNPELLSEIDALRFYRGRGCVRLLAWDTGVGALLLERLLPGTPLSRLCPGDDERATSAAAGVMRALWRPAPAVHNFPTVGRWAAGFQRLRARFEGGTGPLPEARVRQAEQIFADLLASAGEPVLLHGDLHHDNILDAGCGTWRAIDPKGVVGEPAYEVGALLRNPFPALLSWPHPERILARRLAQLSAELGLDRQRLLEWALAQAVLSAWWCVEDRVPCMEGALACADLLAGLGSH
jgi:streptomycin 6-kinase